MRTEIRETASGIVYYDEPEPKKPPPKPEPLEEWELTRGERLLATFRSMPETAQVEVFAILKLAFLRRGIGGILPVRELPTCVNEIADVFAANGFEQEEYT